MSVYLFFLILAGVAEGLLLYVLALNLRTPSQRIPLTLFWFLVGGAGLLLTHGLTVAVASPAVARLGAQFQYAFLVALPVLWLFFALDYSGQRAWLQPTRAWLFGVIPVLSFLLVLTNPLHGLIWAAYRLIEEGRWVLLQVTQYGAWFWVHLAYSYALMLAGAYWILRTQGSTRWPYRWQARWIVFGALLPLLFNLVDLIVVLPRAQQAITPLGYLLAGGIIGGTVLRYDWLGVTPMARQAVFDHLSEGVVVLDAQQRVVDLNRTAQRLFSLERVAWAGQPADVVLPFWPASRLPTGEAPTYEDLCLRETEAAAPTYYEMRITRLLHPRGRLLGYVVTLSDQTERMRYLQAVEQEAQTDPLTGLFNRRMFLQVAERALAHHQASYQPLALLELDIDHFKAINDACGHPIGDAVLVEICRRIQGALRATDTLGRIGGDELMAILPGVTPEDVAGITRRIQREVAERPIEVGGWAIMSTVSVGVVVSEARCRLNLEQLVERADRALYRAKRRGGNTIETEWITYASPADPQAQAGVA
ncbi:diguanylate cyclase [uncultured Thermanaerothrix sp.]|uniref:histidine kinase N-terminal 7TM domain-containing diguanylate cyclase n=1 Tax=uncultured Thermanaerothrix sp. TaxID=1195149 RepID=UPI00260E2506|nr:diguanylate cyclase [uncultured Thermanaerothrix sp.]